MARKAAESNYSKFKEDSAKSEINKEKTIIDISLRLERAQTERQQYELELSKTKDALIRQDQISAGRIQTLEEQLARCQSLYTELDESTRIQIENLQNDKAIELGEIQKKYELALRKKDESIRTLMKDIDNLKG